MAVITDDERSNYERGPHYENSSSADTYYQYGVIYEFDGLDIPEYIRRTDAYKPWSGTNREDYWDTVPDTTPLGPVDDNDYPDYDIQNGQVITGVTINDNDEDMTGMTDEDNNAFTGTN